MPTTTPDGVLDLVRRSAVLRRPIDQAEQDSIARLLAELDRLPDPLNEKADPIHITGSAIVLGPRGVVLLKHKRLGLWLQPGGHVDPGETPWEGAVREAAEEVGLPMRLAPHDDDPELHVPRLVHVDVHAGGRGHTHLDLRYVVRVDTPDGDGEPDPPAGESPHVLWFDRSAAVARASDARLRALLRTIPF